MIKKMDTKEIPRQVLLKLFVAIFLFLNLLSPCHSHDLDGGVNSQQNVTSEPSSLHSSSFPSTSGTSSPHNISFSSFSDTSNTSSSDGIKNEEKEKIEEKAKVGEKEETILSSTGSSSSNVSSNDDSNRNQSKNQLLIISFDGFRYDYFDAFQLDNLQKFSQSGVHAKNGMKGMFTTKTFPSHWSIATGMSQQNHGVVGNRFYDPISKKVFGKKSEQVTKEWFKGEPIWVTAKKGGKSVAIYFWVGSEIDFGSSNLNPNEIKKYNQSVPLEDRINQVIAWLTISKYDLVMMYWNEPDTAGHTFGTFSSQVHQSLERIDGQVKKLMSALKEKDLLDKTNVIILSDHGMVNTTTHLTFTSNVTDNVVYSNEGVVTHFWPKNGSEEMVETFLRHDLAESDQRMNDQIVTTDLNEDELPSQQNNDTNTSITSEEDLSDDRLLNARHLPGNDKGSNGKKNVTEENATEIVTEENGQKNVTEENATETKSTVSRLRRSSSRYTIYKKEQLPEKWKYKHNERVAPIVVVAQEGVYLQQDGSKRDKKAANHGYDNNLLSMRPLFMASGPGFKTNYTFEDPIEMINLYSLFCHLLQVQPSSTNEGSVEEVAHILSSKSSSPGNDHVSNDHVGNDDTADSSSKTKTNSTETGTDSSTPNGNSTESTIKN